MKSLRADFLRLRRSLLTSLVALLLCAGLAFFTWRLATQEDQAQRTALAQGRDLQARFASASTDAADAGELSRHYGEIMAHAWIGQERRLEWSERITQIQQARRLFEIRYELSPQQAATTEILPSGAAAGGFEFMSSTMKLQMQLLHEQDLLGFLDDLAGSVPAFLRVRACRLDRIAPDATAAALGPRLAAECTLDWITLREQA